MKTDKMRPIWGNLNVKRGKKKDKNKERWKKQGQGQAATGEV